MIASASCARSLVWGDFVGLIWDLLCFILILPASNKLQKKFFRQECALGLWLCLCIRWSFVSREIVDHFFSLSWEQALQLRMNMQVVFWTFFWIVLSCLFSQKLGQAYQKMFPSEYVTYTGVQFTFKSVDIIQIMSEPVNIYILFFAVLDC